MAKQISNVRELLKRDKSLPRGSVALAIFTDDRGLCPSLLHAPPPKMIPDATSASWRVSLKRLRGVACVILYHRPEGAHRAAVWRCRVDDESKHKPEKDGRYALALLDLKYCGETRENWPAFAETGSNPLRYVVK